LKNSLSVQELKIRVNRQKDKNSVSFSAPKPLSPEIIMAEKELSSRLQTPVSIQAGEKGGKITIHFYSPEELNQILKSINNSNNE
jgi:hypothetical protein